MGSWDMDEEADLALFSDLGQPAARKGLKSLPPRFQASSQLGISREGSTSLPAHLDRSAVVPSPESASPLPAPGVHCPGTGSCMHPTQLLAYACSCRCQAGPHMLTKTANVTAWMLLYAPRTFRDACNGQIRSPYTARWGGRSRWRL